MSLRIIKDENGFYVELPKDKIKFVSKEAEMMFDLSLENDYLQQENQELKDRIKDLELIVGIKRKRSLISKFNKEYDEEDKKKNPNRTYTRIEPDAEEIYKRYYDLKKQLTEKENQQKGFIEYMNKTIEKLQTDDVDDEEMKGYLIQRIDTFKEILSKYKEIIGGKDE